MLWKSSECQRPAQSSPRSSSRSRKSRPWSVQQARKEAARKRVRAFTEYRHSFTPSAGGGAPGAGQAMMAFPDDWRLIPLSIVSHPSVSGKMIGSRTHGGVDQTLGLIGSDDDVCSSGSYLLFTHSLYCIVVIRSRLSDHIFPSALSLSPLASMRPALNQLMTSLLLQTHSEAQQ